jgi:hypothetical protein
VVHASGVFRHALRGAVPCGLSEGVAVLGCIWCHCNSGTCFVLWYDDVCVYQKGCRSKEERLSTDTPS